MTSSPSPFPLAPYVLALDLGANSVGWAALRLDSGGRPAGLLNDPRDPQAPPSMGVRVFEAGVDRYGQGDREESRNAQRRMARQQRRQAERRARRIRSTFRRLVEAGLLPPPAGNGVDERLARDTVLKSLDESLARRWATRLSPEQRSLAFELLPYLLRAKALDERLEPHEIGRSLYHLAQRRGFKSARRTTKRDDDKERSEVKKSIAELGQRMQHIDEATGRPFARTLGELLLKMGLSGERVRARWTDRQMYLDEFERIWSSQAAHHAEILTSERKRVIWRAIFRQRPLKSQKDLVGWCDLENGDSYRNEDGTVTRT